MVFKIVILCCAFLLFVNTEAYVRRDVSSVESNNPNILESLQKNLDQFRKCLDQSLASTVADVNENKLKPVLTQVGDSLNRVSKAFDDLTAPAPKSTSHE